jgi:hypothetical protein
VTGKVENSCQYLDLLLTEIPNLYSSLLWQTYATETMKSCRIYERTSQFLVVICNSAVSTALRNLDYEKTHTQLLLSLSVRDLKKMYKTTFAELPNKLHIIKKKI